MPGSTRILFSISGVLQQDQQDALGALVCHNVAFSMLEQWGADHALSNVSHIPLGSLLPCLVAGRMPGAFRQLQDEIK